MDASHHGRDLHEASRNTLTHPRFQPTQEAKPHPPVRASATATKTMLSNNFLRSPFPFTTTKSGKLLIYIPGPTSFAHENIARRHPSHHNNKLAQQRLITPYAAPPLAQKAPETNISRARDFWRRIEIKRYRVAASRRKDGLALARLRGFC